MRKFYFLLGITLTVTTTAIAQSVGISEDGRAPHASAILDLSAEGKGLLIPRTDTTAVNANGTPATGLMILQDADFYYYTGVHWARIASGVSSDDDQVLTYTTGGVLSLENGGTVDISELADPKALVTDDDTDTYVTVERSADSDEINFYTAGQENMTLDASGQLGIGLTPDARLHVALGSGERLIVDQPIADTYSALAAGSPVFQTFKENTSGTITRIEVFVRSSATPKLFELHSANAGPLYQTMVDVTGNGAATESWIAIDIPNIPYVDSEIFAISTDNPRGWGFTSDSNAYPNGDGDDTGGGDYAFRVYLASDAAGFRAGDAGVSINDYTFPNADGASDQILQTDGSGTLSWANVSAVVPQLQDIVYDNQTAQLTIESGNTVQINSISDTDGDTRLHVENTADEDNIRFEVNGTEAARIDDLGQMGIGVQPQARLHVDMGDAVVQNHGVSQELIPQFFAQTDFITQTIQSDWDGNITSLAIYYQHTQAQPADKLIQVSYDGGANFYSETLTYSATGWQSIPVPVMAIAAGQSIMIRVNNRQGIAFATGNPYAAGVCAPFALLDIAFRLDIETTSDRLGFLVREQGVTINNYTLPPSDGAAGQALLSNGAGTLTWSSIEEDQTLGFNTDSGELTISEGNMVEVSAIMDTDDDTGITADYLGGDTDQIMMWIAGDEVARITPSKLMGIGTNNPQELLQVGNSGDGSRAIANEWLEFSDKRYKRDFAELDGPLDKVKAINGYYYYWKEGEDDSRQLGVIAQEVQQILPEVVNSDESGYLSVNYSRLTALLIEAMQEQQAIIDGQNDALQELRSELDEQSSSIESLQRDMMQILRLKADNTK